MVLLWVYVGISVGVWTLNWIFEWVQGFLVLTMGERLVFEMRRRLNGKLQALHVGYYERTPVGRIMARILDDVNVIRDWVTSQFVGLMSNVARLLLAIGVTIYLSGKLSVLVLAGLPFYAFTFYRMRPVIMRLHIGMRRLNSRMYARASERISGIHVVKSFARERAELVGFARMAFDSVRVGNRMVYYNQLLSLVAGLITAIVTGLVIYASAHDVQKGIMTIGALVAFYQVLPRLFDPVNFLASLATQFPGMLVVLRRVFALLDEPEEIESGAIKLGGMQGKIHFDHIVFGYPNQPHAALDDVDFYIQPGEKVAIMGPSGSGKSTIFWLLLRFYDPQKGTIRVGGVNLADADISSLRKHVCLVPQEPEIFSGTVADNIAYGRIEATPGEIMTAAEQAELHEFIMTLPVKYETEVGERGAVLSGGQKQRLALATALLTNPEVLLLDDTTSALDAETENRIRITLNRILKGRTSLIITQRISTAKDCDRIIVLEKGRIAQIGTHHDLRITEGFYRRICERQGWNG